MRTGAEHKDWVAAVEAIVSGAPASGAEPNALGAQVRLLALLGSAAPLDVLLDGLATYVESWTEGLNCTVMIVDPTGKLLLPSAAPSLPPSYAQAIGPVTIKAGQGCCGTAAATRETVVVDDVEQSELWVGYAPIAIAHGLRACWSVPIVDDARALLGTLALYYRERRTPSTRELDLIQFAASLAAFVIRRHRDTEKVRASEARVEAAVRGTAIGLWEANRRGEFRWFDNWCERFDVDPCTGDDGYTRWCARVHPDDLQRYLAPDDGFWLGVGDHYTVEYRIRTNSGGWRWLHERGKVTARGGDGAPLDFVGVCFDIENRKQMEDALRKAEDRYDVAVHAARLPVWEYDIASDTVSGNVYWHEALGYRATEKDAAPRLESWLSDVHPDDIAAQGRHFAGGMVDGAGYYESELRIRTARGDYKWLLDRGRVVERNADGTPRRVVGVSVDIDAQKQMEHTLRQSELRLETALWSSKAAYWTIDVGADRAEMSSQFFELTGIDRRAWESERHAWNSRMHPDDRVTARRVYEDYVSGRIDFYECEYRLRTPRGWVWMHDRGHVIERDTAGRPRVIAGTTQDAGARKSLERAIVEATRTEQRRLSHELHDGLGQELSGIHFMLSSLVKRLHSEGSAVADELEQAAALVRQSVATTRSIAHGLAPASLTRGGLRVALQELAQNVSKTYGISIECVSNEWNAMAISETAAQNLYRMSQEALTNARRHGAATAITIATHLVGGVLEVSITDNGSGMPPSPPQATGMGLRIMAHRAQTIGAVLSIDGGPGGGTRVVVRYPLVQVETPSCGN